MFVRSRNITFVYIYIYMLVSLCAPYFPFTGDDACVCWVPVDSVSKESGAMGYVKGSHVWPEYSPNALVTNERTHNDETPTLPNIEANESQYDITYFDAVS